MSVLRISLAEYLTNLSDNRVGYAIEVKFFGGGINDEHCMLISDESLAILLLHRIVGAFFLNYVWIG